MRIRVVYCGMKTKDYRSQISDKWRDAQDRVGTTARNVSRATDRYVRENPWKMIAVVALAACITGYLVRVTRD